MPPTRQDKLAKVIMRCEIRRTSDSGGKTKYEVDTLDRDLEMLSIQMDHQSAVAFLQWGITVSFTFLISYTVWMISRFSTMTLAEQVWLRENWVANLLMPDALAIIPAILVFFYYVWMRTKLDARIKKLDTSRSSA
jgi:hypothetical protein